MRPRNITRNNFGQFQKQATININKKLQKIANELGVDIRQVVADELEKKYKDNILESYGPSSVGGASVIAYNEAQKKLEAKDRELGIKNPRRHRKTLTYKHKNILYDNIYTEIEGNTIKIKIRKDAEYKKPKYTGSKNGIPQYEETAISAEDVWSILINGSSPSHETYPYYDRNGDIQWARNYGTRPHEFELHTQAQMTGFMRDLENNLGSYVDIKKYNLKKARR